MPCNTTKYAIIRAIPDLRRGEIANIGVVAFRPSALDIRLLASLNKVRALDPALNEEALRDYVHLMEALDPTQESAELRHRAIAHLGSVQLSDLGEFRHATDDEYEHMVQAILSDLVVPPIRRQRRVSSRSRLETTIRREFEALSLLGKHVDDIKRHMVVHQYPVEEHGNLSVDFALRNGRWHVTETIDFSAVKDKLRATKFNAAALKAITLDTAERNLGNTVPLVVYQAASDTVLEIIQPSLNLLSGYAEQLYNYADPDERAAYFTRMARAAGREMI